MRKIKFRAWQEQWCDTPAMTAPFSLRDYMCSREEAQEELCKCTAIALMQHTGIGNIYEGDILPPDNTCGENTVICYDIHQACFKRVPISMYKANAGGGGWTGSQLVWHAPDPIGNIYENPELLEVLK